MEKDSETNIFNPILKISEKGTKFMKWEENEKHSLLSTTYSSPLDQPLFNAWDIEKEKDLKENENNLRQFGILKNGEFDIDQTYESPEENKKINDQEKSSYKYAKSMISTALSQTENISLKIQQMFPQNITKPQTSNLSDMFDELDPVAISTVSSSILKNQNKKGNSKISDSKIGPMLTPQSLLSVQSNPSKTSQDFNPLPDLMNAMSPDIGGDMLLNYILATNVPTLLRGVLKKFDILPGKSEPKLLSHDLPPPHQKIESAVGQGYTPEYYASLATAKDIPMWWSHTGANIPPPWFQSNAPPNRAHLGRAAVNVPAPPFKDSPYRSTILDYWTGKRSKLVPPTPAQWPQHHLMAGAWNGDGSMRCPCPGAPQLMCDCQSIEYDALPMYNPKPTPLEKSDPDTYIKSGIRTATSVLSKVAAQPYPEMLMMSLLI